MWTQWFLLVLLVETKAGVYMVMEKELQFVIHGGSFRIYAYVIFLVTSLVMKDVLKAEGYLLDCGKQGTGYCGYYVGEVMAALFYFFFYRMMFNNNTSWGRFAVLHCLHLIFEWICHPFRATGVYYKWVRKMVLSSPRPLGRFLSVVLLTTQPHILQHDWACVVALDA